MNLGLPERNYDPALSSGITTGQRTVPVFQREEGEVLVG